MECMGKTEDVAGLLVAEAGRRGASGSAAGNPLAGPARRAEVARGRTQRLQGTADAIEACHDGLAWADAVLLSGTPTHFGIPVGRLASHHRGGTTALRPHRPHPVSVKQSLRRSRLADDGPFGEVALHAARHHAHRIVETAASPKVGPPARTRHEIRCDRDGRCCCEGKQLGNRRVCGQNQPFPKGTRASHHKMYE